MMVLFNRSTFGTLLQLLLSKREKSVQMMSCGKASTKECSQAGGFGTETESFGKLKALPLRVKDKGKGKDSTIT